MKESVNINSQVYSNLFNEGVRLGIDSDRLISVYCFIKAAKDGKDRIHTIKTSNGREIKNYRLLHRVTKLSEKTLRKYVPLLIKMGLMNFSKDGSVYLRGNRKSAQIEKTKKVLKIIIEATLAKTCVNSFAIRIKTKENRILKAIDKNNSRIKILIKYGENTYLSFKEVKYAKKLMNKGITLDTLKASLNKVILSNEGYYNLKKETTDKKSCGKYWKNKLISAGKIKSRRYSKNILKCTQLEFEAKMMYYNNRNKYSWRKGYMREEMPSEFTTTTFPLVSISAEKKINKKPLSYLSFDFLNWMENN